MDYDISDVVFAYQLEEDDFFRYESGDYKVKSLTDDELIVIRAEVLTDNDDYVTLELDPYSKVELLSVV